MNDAFGRKSFFENIEITLETPLHLAHRNKKTDKPRNAQINGNDVNRYLEDFVITISDLLIYCSLTKMLNKLECIKSELETNYHRICKWYMLMQNDEQVFKAFSTGPKIQFNLINEQELSKKFEKINIQDGEDEKEIVDTEKNMGILLNELKSFVEINYSLQLPIATNKEYLYTYENIKFNWTTIDSLVSPLGGKFHTINC